MHCKGKISIHPGLGNSLDPQVDLKEKSYSNENIFSFQARKRVRQRGRKGRLNEIPLKNTCKAESVNSAK